MTARKPASPCTRRCTLDPATDTCLGCYRTLKEILGWEKYSAKQRVAVLEQLPERKTQRAQQLASALAQKTTSANDS